MTAGTLPRKLGAETSGHVVLYDEAGNLRFSGGITRSRGHVGESDGARALSALLNGSPATSGNFPVFGCRLFTPEAGAQRTNTCQVQGRERNP